MFPLGRSIDSNDSVIGICNQLLLNILCVISQKYVIDL